LIARSKGRKSFFQFGYARFGGGLRFGWWSTGDCGLEFSGQFWRQGWASGFGRRGGRSGWRGSGWRRGSSRRGRRAASCEGAISVDLTGEAKFRINLSTAHVVDRQISCDGSRRQFEFRIGGSFFSSQVHNALRASGELWFSRWSGLCRLRSTGRRGFSTGIGGLSRSFALPSRSGNKAIGYTLCGCLFGRCSLHGRYPAYRKRHTGESLDWTASQFLWQKPAENRANKSFGGREYQPAHRGPFRSRLQHFRGSAGFGADTFHGSHADSIRKSAAAAANRKVWGNPANSFRDSRRDRGR
jgi:hypothetical protein